MSEEKHWVAAAERDQLLSEGLGDRRKDAREGQWVIPTGGGYFFVPSIKALKDVLGS
jgi:hypothetical protein